MFASFLTEAEFSKETPVEQVELCPLKVIEDPVLTGQCPEEHTDNEM